MILNYLAWLILGCLVGWLASQLLPPQRSDQVKSDIVIGAASAFGTGILMQLLIRYPIQNFNVTILIISMFGAVVALATHKTFVRT